MSDEREEKQGLKVNDRRRFDAEGNDRVEESKRVVTPPKEPPAAQPSSAALPPSEGAAPSKPASNLGKPELQGGGGDINFSSFVISLATQALMQLGEMAPPEGMAIEPDLEAARQTIAILGVIQEKTEGNLSEQEIALLTDVLHSCRICYVRRAKGA